MTCTACEVLIERKLRRLPGIAKVKVSHHDGRLELSGERAPRIEEIQQAIGMEKYRVLPRSTTPGGASRREYLEIGAIFLLLVGGYLLLKQFDLVPNIGITENMTYGAAFLMGLVAAMSTCLAVTGGLLLAVSAKHAERHPHLTGYQKFKPHIHFNIGRIVGYTVLGAAVGALGSMLTISPTVNGILTIIVSVIMILLGIQLLNIFPALRRFQPKAPKFLAHMIYDAQGKEHPTAPFLLGSATFFLPCGFTQALQLYVLSTGDAVTGALIMLAFSLGTAPGLISLGAVSSYSKGQVRHYFLRTAGAVVVLLGLFSIGNGFALTGLTEVLPNDGTSVAAASDGQVLEMSVRGYEYSPAKFTITQGVPVEWRIDGRQAAGCAQVITVPKLGITEYLPRDQVKTIRFTPTETGTFGFSCTMGMTTPGAAFTVLPNNAENRPQTVRDSTDNTVCDPALTDCNVQKLQMEISKERGFFPKSFTVQKNIPVELEIDAKIQLNGCMGTMIIPEYNVAHRLVLGKSILRFTPTRAGTFPFTCSMGSRLGQFAVTE